MTATTKTQEAETAAATVKEITIVTHDGIFHADDVFAVGIIKTVFKGKGHRVQIKRTRDPQIIATANFVVDVGMVDNAAGGRFDHHQWNGSEPESKRNNGKRLASAGLVWSHFGARLIETLMCEMHQDGFVKPESEPHYKSLISRVIRLVDNKLISGIDAADCGVATLGDGMTISQIVAACNLPKWVSVPEAEAFDAAMRIALISLVQVVISSIEEARAEQLVVTYVSETPRGSKVLIMPEFVPWKGALKQLAAMDGPMRDAADNLELVIFPSPEGKWMVQCVPGDELFSNKMVTISADGRNSSPGLPVEWAGLNGEKLAEVTGVEDAVFCHNGRFVAAAATREGVKQLAKLALKAAGYGPILYTAAPW